MSGDRSIHLDLGMPPGTGGDIHRQGAGGQPMPDQRSTAQLEGDALALRELLQAQRGGPATAPAAPVNAADSVRPFDLFGQAARASVPSSESAPARSDVPAGLDATLSHMAQRLLVGDGSSGRRAVQIQLSNDALPGVVMDVFEDAGAVVAEFTCSQESSRERLVHAAQWLADGLHASLQRTAVVRVQTDDPEDRCLIQAQAGS